MAVLMAKNCELERMSMEWLYFSIYLAQENHFVLIQGLNRYEPVAITYAIFCMFKCLYFYSMSYNWPAMT